MRRSEPHAATSESSVPLTRGARFAMVVVGLKPQERPTDGGPRMEGPVGSLTQGHTDQAPTFRGFGLLAAALAMLGVAFAGSVASALVLCRGLDGHLAIEWATGAQCVEEAGGAQDGRVYASSALIRTSKSAAGERCCGPCNDTPLLVAADPLLSATPPVAPGVSFAGQLAFSASAITRTRLPGCSQLEGNLPSRTRSDLGAYVRTIVIRC